MKAVDLFAGAGGLTTGAVQAGVQVVACVNHWPRAVETHALNHPNVIHRCQDVALMDPRDLPPHDLLMAAPACQGHSPARGKDRPHHDASRATAWAVVDVAEVTRPRWLIVENVPAIRKWKLFPAWENALTLLGYHLSAQVLNAADFAVPQLRERVIIVGRLGRRAPHLTSPGLPHVPARSFMDWSAGTWRPVAEKVEATRNRVARARRDGHGERFVMPYYGSGSGETGRSLDRPLGTVPAADVWAAVDGDRMRMLTVTELQAAMGFPGDYRVLGDRADVTKQLGNAVCPPMAREVVRQILEAA